MINELTTDQFNATMTEKMVNVTETAEPVLDIWPYVELLAAQGLVHEYVFQNNLVEAVMRNSDGTFDQILLPTSRPNNFVIIIVDILNKRISGHYLLDLNKEYGIQG